MNKILDLLGGGLIKQVGDVLDNLTTSKEEKLEAKQKIEEVFMRAEAQAQEQVSKRWEADMKSDAWLPKNIRPLILSFLTIILVLMSFVDGNVGEFVMDDAYKPIYQTLLITVYGAYFAGRSIEKIKKS